MSASRMTVLHLHILSSLLYRCKFVEILTENNKRKIRSIRNTFIQLPKVLVIKDCKDQLLVLVQVLQAEGDDKHKIQSKILKPRKILRKIFFQK